MGYPKQIGSFKFNPSFAIRGLIFDNYYGNLVKVSRPVACKGAVLHLFGSPNLVRCLW